MTKKLVFFLFYLIFLFIPLSHADLKSDLIERSLGNISQDPTDILKKLPHQYEISSSYQDQLVQNYLQHYYAVWDNNSKLLPSLDQIKASEKLVIDQYSAKPGWDVHRHPHSKEWITPLIENQNFSNFPNAKTKAIIINDTYLRGFPTIVPAFGDPEKAGQGYPFDNWQIAYLRANLPILILNNSKDGAWKFVVTSDYSWGWVQTKDIAYVSDDFIAQWRKVNQFIFPLNDNSPVQGLNSQFYFLTRKGAIYPTLNEDNQNYKIEVAVKDTNDQAVIKTGFIAKQNAQPWPLKANSQNVAQIAKPFMGSTYGWGEMYGYRDCSSTVKSIFSPFGFWLPRSSKAQADLAENFISLEKLNDREKLKYIAINGIPFFSLLSMQGHVLLYVGTINDEVYVLHEVWGVHTKSAILRKEGRAIIGYTVITPVNLGQHNWSVGMTWLTGLTGIIYLAPQKELTEVPKTPAP